MENHGRCNNCTRWGMESVESKDAGQVEILDVGIWTPAGSSLKDDLMPHIKGNFRGRRIPVASVEYPPWTTYVRDDDGKFIKYSGVIFEVLTQISHKLNFTYNGMIKQVMNKEVMLGAAAFATTLDRMKVVNF